MSERRPVLTPEEMPDVKTAPDITVDRGQPVIVTVIFGDPRDPIDPDEVYFAYTHPQEERQYVDDGYGQPQSRIMRLGKGTYRYTFSTRDYKAGDAWWHFWGEWAVPLSEGYVEADIFGRYHVNHAPPQLL